MYAGRHILVQQKGTTTDHDVVAAAAASAAAAPHAARGRTRQLTTITSQTITI